MGILWWITATFNVKTCHTVTLQSIAYNCAAHSVLGNINDFITIVNIVNNNSLTRGQNGRWHGRPHRCNNGNSEILNTSSQPNVTITQSSNKRSIQTALILCQPLKNKLCDKYCVGILSVFCVILAPTRRPLYQEKTLQTKFLMPLLVLMSYIK